MPVAAIDACIQRPSESALGMAERPSAARRDRVAGRTIGRKETRDDAMMNVQKARRAARSSALPEPRNIYTGHLKMDCCRAGWNRTWGIRSVALW